MTLFTSDPPPPAPRPTPAQLPADVAAFAGRAHHLRHLDALLTHDAQYGHHADGRDGDQSTAVVITAIAGTAGVGKPIL